MLVSAAVAGIVDQDERSHRRLDDTSGSFAAGSFCRYGRIVTDEMREHPDTSKMRGDRPAFHRLSVEARSFRPRVIPTARIRKPRRSCVRTPTAISPSYRGLRPDQLFRDATKGTASHRISSVRAWPETSGCRVGVLNC